MDLTLNLSLYPNQQYLEETIQSLKRLSELTSNLSPSITKQNKSKWDKQSKLEIKRIEDSQELKQPENLSTIEIVII